MRLEWGSLVDSAGRDLGSVINTSKVCNDLQYFLGIHRIVLISAIQGEMAWVRGTMEI